MNKQELITKRFERNIAGVLSCFDRLVLFGTYKPVCYPKAMSWQLHEERIRLIDYEKRFANAPRLQMTARIKDIASEEGIKIEHVYTSVRKEAFVSEILTTRGDAPGIVCILSTMESCRCFKAAKNHKTGYLELQWKPVNIVFKSNRILPVLYEKLLRTAAVEIKCSDIYGFLGRRLTAKSASEVSNRLQTLIEATRIKHTLETTSIKMYDKQGNVLRIEITASNISFFKHHREVKHRDGTREMKHAPLRKTIYSLGAVAEQMQACNRRYLSFISQWRDHRKERTDLRRITCSVKDEKQRSYRGLNFFLNDDLCFMLAILRGEYQIAGFSNRNLQPHLPGGSSQKIGRVLKRFRVLRLIKWVGRTYKYYLSALGKRVLVAALQVVFLSGTSDAKGIRQWNSVDRFVKKGAKAGVEVIEGTHPYRSDQVFGTP